MNAYDTLKKCYGPLYDAAIYLNRKAFKTFKGYFTEECVLAGRTCGYLHVFVGCDRNRRLTHLTTTRPGDPALCFGTFFTRAGTLREEDELARELEGTDTFLFEAYKHENDRQPK